MVYRTPIAAVVWSLLTAACHPGASSRELPENRGPGADGLDPDAALAALHELATAMKTDDAGLALAVADARDGVVFWGQPAAYPRPLFRVPPGSSGPLSELAAKAGADAYYVEASGYWRETGEALDRALAVARRDAGPYEVPPEEALASTPPWGSLDTRDVMLTPEDHPALAEESEFAGLAANQRQLYRFRAEVGGSSVQVYMTASGISHVILSWHYDA